MATLKQWISTAVITMLTSFSASATEDINRTEPYQMMKAVADKTFTRLKEQQPEIKQNPDHLKVIVEEELMPYVNDRYAALKLLGPNLKKAKKEDVRVFIDAFRAYLVTSYAQVLTQYTDQQIVFSPERDIDPERRIMSISVEIVDKPNPNIKLDFKLRKDKKTAEWAAFDMVAEGISLLSSKQSEWNGKIRKDGILAVSKELQNIANQSITVKER